MTFARSLVWTIPLVIAAAPATSQPALQADMTERIVNDPRPEAFTPYGFRLPPRVVRDKAVQFGKALRLPIPRAEPQDWTIGLTTPVLKPIKTGDRIVIAFWARAVQTEGGAPGKIARVRFEESTAPFRPLFELPVVVGPQWKMYQVSGAADRDYGPQQLQTAVHLAAAKQVIDMGPMFILRYPRGS